MLTSIALAAVVSISTCSWDRPGANRFTGDVAAAVQSYTDIPKDVRDRLQKRLDSKKYDEVVEITRDAIRGRHEYEDLREMHFGSNRLCRTITRDKWKPEAKERGLVYCEAEHCVIVPTVCGNLSRITRRTSEAPKETGGAGESAGGAGIPVILQPIEIAPVPSPSFVDLAEPKPAVPFLPTSRYEVLPMIFVPYVGTSIVLIHTPLPAVPEPSTWISTILGLLGLAGYKKFGTRNKSV